MIRLGGVAVVLASVASAQTPVRVTAINGKQTAGELRGLDAQGRLIVAAAGAEVAHALDEIRDIVPAGAVPVAPPPAGLVMLWSGTTLRANVRGVVGTGATSALLVEVPPARSHVALPLRTVRALRTTEQPHADGDSFDAALADTASKGDKLFAYRRGDASLGIVRLTVTVQRIVQEGDDVRVIVDLDGKEQPPLPLGKVYGVVFGAGVAPDAQGGARVTVQTAGGAAFTGTLQALAPAEDRLVLRLDEGCAIDLPWRHVARLDVRSDRLVFLSDLPPSQVEQVPALTRVWPWLKDRAPLGTDIVLRGEAFARGLVLIPRTRLSFDVGARFDRFEAVVGIDDRAADVADAVVRVLGDDKVLFAKEHVRRGALPYPVQVSIKDVRRLTLEVDFGDNLDFSDHVAFADARLLRDR